MKLVNALGDGLRRTGTAIGGTITYVSQKHGSGFEHEEFLSIRIDQFIGMHDAHKKWSLETKAYGDVFRKFMAADAVFCEAMSALSLHDFPSEGANNAALLRRAAEQKKIATALEEWNTGFSTVEVAARDLVKEMDDIQERIDDANKQVAELAFLKKKEKDCTAEQSAYNDVAKQLLEDILSIMNKKDDLLKNWLAKLSAIDYRLHEIRTQVLSQRKEEEEKERKAMEERRRLEEEKKNKWREEKPGVPPLNVASSAVAPDEDAASAAKPRATSPRNVPVPPNLATTEAPVNPASPRRIYSPRPVPKPPVLGETGAAPVKPAPPATDATQDEEEEESDD